MKRRCTRVIKSLEEHTHTSSHQQCTPEAAQQQFTPAVHTRQQQHQPAAPAAVGAAATANKVANKVAHTRANSEKQTHTAVHMHQKRTLRCGTSAAPEALLGRARNVTCARVGVVVRCARMIYEAPGSQACSPLSVADRAISRKTIHLHTFVRACWVGRVCGWLRLAHIQYRCLVREMHSSQSMRSHRCDLRLNVHLNWKMETKTTLAYGIRR